MVTLLTCGAGPLRAQIKRVPLNPAARSFGVPILPANDTFDIVVRATDDLFEFQATRIRIDTAGTLVTLPAWIRPLGVGAKEATIRLSGLQPGARYRQWC